MKMLNYTSALVTAALLISGAALAEDYPTKDVRMVVNAGAGGGTDGIVRKLSSIAEKDLGHTIYIENVEGGASGKGTYQVMTARPDGYTIGNLTYDSVITVPYQKLLPGYEMSKLAWIGRVTLEPDAIVVAADSEYKTLEDLIAAAKENPGEIRVAVQNSGSRTHLDMLRLQDMADVEFNLIAYAGGAAPQKEAILNGEVEVAVTSLGDFSNLIEEGDVRGLVEFSGTPNPTYSDVPLAKDQGYDIQAGSYIILAAPQGTPDDIVNKLADTFHKALDSEEFQKWVSKVGVTPGWLGPDEVGGFVEEQQNKLFTQMDDLKKQGILK
ncbi:Bug family tripartite tricarboxylate transporter substrate binding protein [Consotaella salsifontis]|uniref:Tripartite-type tricarboxylate transporter, receptor component TctC n=1 Tax=Consotaella salsifontis TaxID=1365950 RepID=A0A1T4LI91_9HYPH|nr:tripartite tricarboxylate transporter substrate binding protein [Consotaella salsifontis]SJZ54482.1 Tripartite-type tricarboxylate transporter, receptor component TctC [Consotaella salsifontis]